MASEVVMPQMGADMTEGTLLRWLKQEGDSVERGEVIAEIETDKANIEIEAFDGGVFRKALAHEGDVVKVGEVIAVVAAADEDISRYGNGASPAAANASPTSSATVPKSPSGVAVARDAAPQVEPAPSGEQPPAPAPPADVRAPQPAAASAPPPPADGRVRASPLARRIANERGIDLHTIRGTGPDGRIVRKDVEATSAAVASPTSGEPRAPSRQPQAAPVADRQVAPTRMRQAIARRMSQSKREAPHYYLLVDVDMTDASALRRQINETLGEDVRVSINDLIVRACALALRRHPAFNATIDGETVTEHAAQNVCIAVALDEGLIAPAVLDAGAKSLAEIALATKDVATRAKGGSLRPDEVTSGTFTITNLGAFGVETLIGIIQPPQTAILGTGSVMQQPAVHDGQIVARDMMKLALSADHRVTDGAQGARFLAEIKRLLEKPLLLVL